MKKILRRWGKSLVISFNLEEQKSSGLKEGVILDLTDMVVEKPKEIIIKREKRVTNDK